MKAWHFVGETLRDGRPIPKDGEWLDHDYKKEGPIEMCVSGLHASLEPFDAFKYAPGDTLCYVECVGIESQEKDKLVCARRRIIARMDATDMLRYFARMQALSVIHLWDAPEIVLDYLMTSDELIRDAAWAAAWDAAWDAAGDAAWDAAGDAAGDAARDAAGDAAWAAAWAAARDAAWDAARAAAGDAAWAAARDAARAAAWDAAGEQFNSLVYECFEEVI